MKTLFSEIYNKFLEIFQIEKSENTSTDATNRLKVILMHDRTKLDPLIMSKMREELIEVFSKYVVINKEELEIDLGNNGDAAALMLNIPIIRAKTEEELEELRKQLQEEEEKVSDADDDEEEEIVEGEATEVIEESIAEPTEEPLEKAEKSEDDEIVEEEEDKE
ncbi:cell division topological specificity factor MinE [bacterium]|nr:cell division topological specificity factor MinE [bacterium]